nr:sialoadhesin-like [Danio rerio]|eukprot:XP_021333840.1 sialoadhesin-like [Danio rerio]
MTPRQSQFQSHCLFHDSTPQPVHDSTSDPVLEPVYDSTPEPVLEPVPHSTPDSESVSVQGSTPDPVPKSMPVHDSIPVSDLIQFITLCQNQFQSQCQSMSPESVLVLLLPDLLSHQIHTGFLFFQLYAPALLGVSMMMSVRMAPHLTLLILLMIHRISCADWGVNYSAPHCALKNSTVIMSCNYTYPTGHQIVNVFWTKEKDRKEKEDHPDLLEDPEYSQRLQYLGDEQKYSTIRLSQVTKKDEHRYFCRIITNKPGGKWIDVTGVRLSVTDLQLESPERVTEGDSVRLTCRCSCKLTDTPTFIWYRNSHTLTEETTGDKLILKSVRREDAGRYRCAVNAHTLTSPEVYLNVMYPPRNVSVSITDSGQLWFNSVSLVCISDSNPPALNFSWFKENQSSAVGSGQSFSAVQSGRFYCEAHNPHGAQRSDAVTVTVKGHPVLFYIAIGVVCGSAVFITVVIIWGIRRKRNATQSQLNHSRGQDDRGRACNDDFNQPVYENATALQVTSDHCKPELDSSVYENLPVS